MKTRRVAGGPTPVLATPTSRGLYCAAGGFYIDRWRPVERAVITHAHGDHARPGSAAYLAARRGLPVLQTRLGPDARIEGLERCRNSKPAAGFGCNATPSRFAARAP